MTNAVIVRERVAFNFTTYWDVEREAWSLTLMEEDKEQGSEENIWT
jgi:hypothetical protein